jgi:hypothetical protein
MKKKPESFYIQDGVRRAVASREAGRRTIPAIIYQEGRKPKGQSVKLSQLHSPKHKLPVDDRFFRITPPISIPIQIELLGLPGQLPTVPLAKVKTT